MFFARLAGREVARRLGSHRASRNLIFLLPLVPVVLVLGAIVLISLLVFVVVSGQNAGGCGTSVPIAVPGLNVQTASEAVRYLESQGVSANGAAGIVGNFQQESGMDPAHPGGGLAQWVGGRWVAMASYATSRGLDPNSMAGQLTYVVYDLRTSYAGLLAQLNAAPDPGTAATMFETTYELCSGVTGWMQVAPGSPCNDPARRQYAVAALSATGTAVPVSLAMGGTCVAIGGGSGDPIPGFSPGRDDMGVDACAKPGMPVYAPASSVLVGVVPNWYAGQPLLLFQFNPPLAGAFMQDAYWYVAEQVVPVSTIPGMSFSAGQPVAVYAPSGTCIEIGWGDPATNSRTLAEAMGRVADAHPGAGALTPEAEAFKQFFHLPWVGQSP